MKKIGNYTFFWKAKIGQWTKSPFTDNEGIKYCCAEQYMFSKKALLFGDIESNFKIMDTNSPKEQQKLGRLVKDFNQKIWDLNKVGIVRNANIYKFSQNKDLYDVLISTKGTELVEASPYDKIWGIGMGVDEKGITDPLNWKGENLLGSILTELRDGDCISILIEE